MFVPRGVGNAFQTLEDATSYTYLVNDHWRPGTTYPALALDDATAAIPWPIPLDRAEVSDKDREQNPRLDGVTPMAPLAEDVHFTPGAPLTALVTIERKL